MKIYLINPPSKFLINPMIYPSYSLMLVASHYRSELGYEVEIVDLNCHDIWENKLKTINADLFGITCTSPNVPIVKKIIDYLHDFNKKVIIGGAHPRYTNDNLNADFVCKDKIGLGLLPARDLIDQSKYTNTVVYTSFGCHFSCNFCVQEKYWEYTLPLLKQDLEYVIDHGAKYIVFGDDNINLNTNRLYKILDLVDKYDIQFRLNMDSRNITMPMLDSAKWSGCDEISIGIESGSQTILDNMNKKTTVINNIEAIQMIKNSGIKCKIYLIVNFPGETEQTIDETISFLDKTKPDKVLLSQFAPLPGSDTYNHPDKYGITWMSPNWSDYYLAGKEFHSCFETKKLPKEKQQEFYNKVKGCIK